VQRMNAAFRIDCQRATRHHLNFRFAILPRERVKLPIRIADANIVEIYKGQFANAGTNQRFDGPGSHTTDPDDANVRASQAFQALRRIQSGYPSESRLVS
jgi:hypothetical protein